MELIKTFNTIDLAVYDIPVKSKWIAPQLLLLPSTGTDVTYAGLSESAATYLAKCAGLNTVTSAESLAALQPEKWKMFLSPLEDSTLIKFWALTSRDGLKIYRFISDAELGVLEELDYIFERATRSNGKFLNADDGFLILETTSAGVMLYTFFDPSEFKLLSLSTKPTETSFVTYIAFNKKLIGKKYAFVADDLDLDMIEYELSAAELMPPQPLSEDDFMLSLRELIVLMRTTQKTRQLAGTLNDFIIRVREVVDAQDEGFLDETFDDISEQFFESLKFYLFYYDNKKTRIDDFGLIFDKLRTPKAHLYFSEELKFNLVKTYLDTILAGYMKYINEEDEAVDTDSFKELFIYYDKLMKNVDFDWYKIQGYYTYNQ